MNTDNILSFDFFKVLPPEFLTSLLVMVVICVFSFVLYFKQKKYKALDKPKGIVNLMEVAIEYFENMTNENMGRAYKPMIPYFMVLAFYILLGFVVGMMGIPNLVYLGEDSLLNSSKLFSALPNPFTNLTFPLCIGLITWVLIQFNSLRYNHLSYFKQFFSPIPLVGFGTVWAPMISLSLRLFGNAFAGFCLSTIVYVAFSQILSGIGLVLVPAVMPFFHAYFDLFSGFIQTLVFVTLTMMDIAQEGPDQEEQMKAISLKNAVN